MPRKFPRSQLALACPVDIVEALMGHSAYLAEAYRRYTKQIAEYYRKAEHFVRIQIPKEIREIESEFRIELEKNGELKEKLRKVEEEIKLAMNFCRR